MTVAKGQTITGRSLSDIAKVTTRHKTDEGYLDVNANISRSGIYEYQAGELGIADKDPAQIIRVLRTDDEVFSEQSMQSFTKKPVTDGHPPTLVDSDNNRYYNVGMSGERAVRDGDIVSAKLLITDKNAVDKIENGTVELSCGYKVDIIVGSGNDPKHGTYDAIQKNIRGNHIAIVGKGRAGNTCKIKDKQLHDNKGANMLIAIVDGISIETPEQAKQVIEKLQNEAKDSAISIADAIAAHKAEIEKMTTDHKAAVDKIQAELDLTKKEILSDEQIDARVAERASIIDAASKVIKDFKADGKSNLDIKKEVVQAKHSDMNLDDSTDEYIAACFDITMKKFSQGSDNFQVVGDKKPGDMTPTGDELADARNKSIKDGQNAWKKETA